MWNRPRRRNRLPRRWPNPNDRLSLLKNSAVWFQFARDEMSANPCEVSLDCNAPDRVSISFPTNPTAAFLLAFATIDETGVTPAQQSGVPSKTLESLDRSLRGLRASHPLTPLGAYLKPEAYWTRGPAWLLGEYLAERDLLLWVDLTHLHPERAVAWGRLVHDCGLACARTFVRVRTAIQPEDLPLLQGTGTWLVRGDIPSATYLLHQL